MDEHYINCLVLEFGRYYKISKENIEKAYQIAMDELKDELATYFAVHGCIKTVE